MYTCAKVLPRGKTYRYEKRSKRFQVAVRDNQNSSNCSSTDCPFFFVEHKQFLGPLLGTIFRRRTAIRVIVITPLNGRSSVVAGIGYFRRMVSPLQRLALHSVDAESVGYRCRLRNNLTPSRRVHSPRIIPQSAAFKAPLK